jgi:predicted  nucleic acid-binding Zn-ribbon protein
MHEELFVIRDLNHIDGEIETARGALAKMIADVRATTDAINAAKKAIVETTASLDAVKEEERKLNRRMEEYILRRDRTKKLIDAGQAPDFLSAQRQLEQCAAIVDDLEVEVLEQMEHRETLEAQIATTEAQVVALREQDNRGRGAYTETSPGLKAEIAALTERRPALLDRLNPDYRRVYGDHHKAGRRALTHINYPVCAACHLEAPAQIIIEVEQGKRIRRCRGCDRFFFSVNHPGLEESG